MTGIELKNPLMHEVRLFYPDEYMIGVNSVKMINDRFNTNFNLDEASFIALHFVNAQIEDGIPVAFEITKIIQEILSIVRIHFKITFNEDSVYYYRFITHLKFFAQRLLSKSMHKETTDEKLLTMIEELYSDSYKCVLSIAHLIKKEYHYDLSEEERLYLTIHIEKVVTEMTD